MRCVGETEILKELTHPHIINFGTVWENEAAEQICFTTEIVTSGTLKQYISRVKGVKLKVIKKYTHSHSTHNSHRIAYMNTIITLCVFARVCV